MTTPAKTTALAAINTAFTGITVANGYKSTVVTVEQKILDWQAVTAAMRPWIGYRPAGPERFEPQGPGHLWVTMPLYIGAHVWAATEAALDLAIVNLEDDIIAALYSDPTLGETVVDVKIINGQDDIGDPDRGIGGGDTGFSGTLDQNWEITYERTTSST